MWPTEDIPDQSCVFIRVYKFDVSSQDGNPKKSAFLNTPTSGSDLSCDWDRYHDAYQAQEQIAKEHKPHKEEFKNKEDFYIYSFYVTKLRNIDSPVQKVAHNPIFNDPEIIGSPNNRAHSGIFGSKTNDAKFRSKLVKCGSWSVVRPPQDPDLRLIDNFISQMKSLKHKDILQHCSSIIGSSFKNSNPKYESFVSNLEKLLTNKYKIGGISPELLQKAEPILDELIQKGEIERKIKDFLNA